MTGYLFRIGGPGKINFFSAVDAHTTGETQVLEFLTCDFSDVSVFVSALCIVYNYLNKLYQNDVCLKQREKLYSVISLIW